MRSLLLLTLFALLTGISSAQIAAGNSGGGYLTVGTATNVSGTHWVYLVWQPERAGLLPNQTFAVYRKAGAASSINPYSRESITRLQTNSTVLTPLLSRGQKLGDDLTSLSMTLSDMHHGIANTLSLQDKLSSVLREATTDPKTEARMYVLGRAHPTVALAMGNAYAAALPGPGTHTIEIRVWDSATSTDKFVLGRVTVSTPSSSLPAPTSLYAFAESNEKGHLNMKLRWATPDPLRLRALEHYGFNVYRLTKSEAEGRGWHSTPPTPSALLSAVGTNSDPAIQRINHFPILPSKRLDATAARLITDTDTAFFTDDNKRFSTMAPRPPLADGAEYYYFVTARDVLGRDGLVSQGVLARLSDRVAPRAPTGVTVTNEFAKVGGTRRQFLRVTWDASKPETEGTGIAGYQVYRYDSDRDIIDPSKGTLIGTTAALPTSLLQVDDTGAGAPDMSVAGQVYWYTVRAFDSAWAASNFSGHSAPGFGAIKDREGPAAFTASAGGFITSISLRPSVLPNPAVNNAVPATVLKNGASPRTLTCLFNKPQGLEWAEFRTNTGVLLGRVDFRRDTASSMKAVLTYRREKPADDGQEILSCTVGTRTGRISNTQLSPVIAAPAAGFGVSVTWEARVTRTPVFASTPEGATHDRDGEDGLTENISGQLLPSADTRELRLYRRIDDGELTLIEQTTFAAGTAVVDWADNKMPAGSCRVCYFSQALDKNGNPSAMTLLGCVKCESITGMPIPTLLPIEPAGTASAPEMTVRWFGAKHGVTRYELYVSADNEAYSTPAPAAGLSQDLATGNHPYYPNGQAGMDCSIHETANVIALSLTANSYSYSLPVAIGVKYKVLVRAVGVGDFGARSSSDFSNLGEFEWTSAASVAGIDVPWPARQVISGSAATGYHAGIKAITLPAGLVQGWQGVGIRIGMLDLPPAEAGVMLDTNGVDGSVPVPNATPLPGNMSRYKLSGHIDLVPQLYKNENAAANEANRGSAAGIVFPIVIYRYQVPNVAKPTVSNDVVQVTPLMEQIAYQHTAVLGSPATIVHDPFVCVANQTALAPGDPGTHDIYVLDRLPVIRGASYRYVIVRLNQSTREIERVLTTNNVTIP